MSKIHTIICLIVVVLCLGVAIILDSFGHKPEILVMKDNQPTNSLTWEEILKLPYPREYISYTILPENGEVISENDYLYTTNTSYIIPDLNGVVDAKILYSTMEDDMIYTLAHVIYIPGAGEGNILFVNEPKTYNWVACSVENDGFTTLYSFKY